jgi:hypothetical protein
LGQPWVSIINILLHIDGGFGFVKTDKKLTIALLVRTPSG